MPVSSSFSVVWTSVIPGFRLHRPSHLRDDHRDADGRALAVALNCSDFALGKLKLVSELTRVNPSRSARAQTQDREFATTTSTLGYRGLAVPRGRHHRVRL